MDLIRKRLIREEGKMSEIEVHTVDGFQGREKEAIIVSFTRSNSRGTRDIVQKCMHINLLERSVFTV